MKKRIPYSAAAASSHASFLAKLGATETVAYFDETFRKEGEHGEHGFYSICAVVLQGQHIASMQQDLQNIVGGTYWHSTEALRDGQEQTFFDLLDHMRAHPTMNVIVTTTDITDPSSQAMEQARQEVLSEILVSLAYSDDSFRGAILEQRNSRQKNNADDGLVRQLRKEGKLPDTTTFKLITPSINYNLWLPDIAATAYRRTITHRHNDTSRWFDKYLARFSHITVMGENTTMDSRVLGLLGEKIKSLQNNPTPDVLTDNSSLAFLRQQNEKIPLAKLIEKQLRNQTLQASDNQQSPNMFPVNENSMEPPLL